MAYDKLQIKKNIIETLIKEGIDFNSDPDTLPLGIRTRMRDMANEVGYKRPKTCYYTLGGAFFIHLKKIYNNKTLW